jgi:hypothetical protein
LAHSRTITSPSPSYSRSTIIPYPNGAIHYTWLYIFVIAPRDKKFKRSWSSDETASCHPSIHVDAFIFLQEFSTLPYKVLVRYRTGYLCTVITNMVLSWTLSSISRAFRRAIFPLVCSQKLRQLFLFRKLGQLFLHETFCVARTLIFL